MCISTRKDFVLNFSVNPESQRYSSARTNNGLWPFGGNDKISTIFAHLSILNIYKKMKQIYKYNLLLFFPFQSSLLGYSLGCQFRILG